MRFLWALTPDYIAELCGNNKTIRLVVRIDTMADQVMTLYNRGYITIKRDDAKLELSCMAMVPYKDEASAGARMKVMYQQLQQSVVSWNVGDSTTIWKGPKVIYESWIAPELEAVIPVASKTIDYQVNRCT